MAYVAIDIGGSMIKAAVVSSQGQIISRLEKVTPLEDYKALLEALKQIVIWSREIDLIEGIAISQPCVTDSETAMALSEGALIYIKNQNPAKDMGEYFKLPFAAENDGNCAALAEIWLGSARDLSDIALVVCGTGIGGALIKNKSVHKGVRLFAGEFGMMVVDKDQQTKKPLMWSEVGSTYALVRAYAQRTQQNIESVNGKVVFERSAGGDPIAAACINEFYEHFALGLHNIQHVFDPQAILIGGGISTRSEMIDEINHALKRLYSGFELYTSMPNIRRSTFLADGNLLGATYHLVSRI